jgi:hypothetical protein
MAKRGRKAKPAQIAAAETVTEPAGTTKTKQRGRKSQYSDDERKAFLTSVRNGRDNDVPWNEIYEAVKINGFKGSLPYLMKMAATAGGAGSKRGKIKKIPVKRGRPKGSRNVKRKEYRAGDTGKLTGVAGLQGVNAIVEAMVEERLLSAMTKAVAALERATDKLRKL